MNDTEKLNHAFFLLRLKDPSTKLKVGGFKPFCICQNHCPPLSSVAVRNNPLPPMLQMLMVKLTMKTVSHTHKDLSSCIVQNPTLALHYILDLTWYVN